MRLSLRIVLVALLCASTAQAITYEEWLAEVPSNSPAQIGFESLTEKGSAMSIYGGIDMTPVPSIPPDRMIGSIYAIASSEEKIFLNLFYDQVNQNSLIKKKKNPATTEKDPNFSWNKPANILHLSSAIGSTCLEQSYEITAFPLASNFRMGTPVVLPRLGSPMDLQGLVSVRAELSDKQGRIIARKLLVEAYNASGEANTHTGWTLEGVDEEITKRWPEYDDANILMRKIRALPDSCAAYASVKLVRLTNSAHYNPSPEFLRRLLLMGVWVNGSASTVSTLASSIGLPNNGCPVFSGGLGVARPGSPQNDALKSEAYDPYGRGYTGTSFSDDSTLFPDWNASYLKLIKQYRYWTMILLGIFTAFIGVGVPICLFRLKPHRRLLLWWSIPVFSFAFAILNYAAGHLLLQRHALADVIECRYIYPGWPEMFCRVETRLLNFDNEFFTWQMPPGAWHAPFSGFINHPLEMENYGPTATEVSYSKLNSGYRTPSAWNYFAPAQEVVVSKWSPDGKSIEIEAKRPLKQVFVGLYEFSQKVGPMKAGETRTITPSIKENERTTVPAINGFAPPVAKPCGCLSFPWLNIPKDISGVVVALGDDQPLIHLKDPSIQPQQRVLWCVQLPEKP